MTRRAKDSPSLPLRREAVRKALHLSLVALPVLYSRGVARDVLVLSLGGGVLLALAVESARRASPHIGAGFERAFGTLLRERERAAVTGATWLLAACFAAVLALPREAAVAALWCAAAGDPAATLVGRATAALRGAAAPLTKTPAGSAACFITSLAGTWALAPFPLTAAALIALLATLVERLPLSLDDNLRVPAAAGVTAWLLS